VSARRKPLAPEVTAGTEVGPYRVKARLGAGGFATVFLAESGGVLYALKLLALRDVGEWAEREVVVLARMRHPNVARLCGFWQWPEEAPRYHVVVMEYVPGRRLDVWTGMENPSARQVLSLVLGVARGLAEAHRSKVVHRDVKEANIIVREPGGEAVLVDFGVSGCEEASRVTRGMMPPGTVEYRSPEAWRFRRENRGDVQASYRPMPADDVYALGVVLYWLLTDGLPFSESDGPGLEALLTRPPVAPHVLNPRVPPELGELCLRLLCKQPEDRPDAEAVGKAVEALLARPRPEWEVPLCEDFNEHNLTTLPGEEVDEEALWLNQMKQAEARPRRGKRPPRGEPSAPAAPEPVPARSVEMRLRMPAMGRTIAVWVLAVALGAVAVHSLVLLPLPTLPPTQAVPAARTGVGQSTQVEAPIPTWEGGWKLAPPLESLEAQRSGLLGFAGSMLEKDDASVKTPQQKQKKLGTVKKALAAAGACTVLGCTGTQVRPDPEPKPCPPGAVEAMKERGIDVGSESVGFLLPREEDNQWTAVSEGWINVRPNFGPWKAFPGGSMLSGHLTFGEKLASIRLTQARTKNGTFPVCIEAWDRDEGHRGLFRRDDGKVFSSFDLRAVDHFE
jgi:serine/threonine protein kinase